MKVSVPRIITRTALVIGVMGAVAGPATSAMASDAPALPKLATVKVTPEVFKQTRIRPGKHLTKADRRAMARAAKRIKDNASKSPTGQNKVGGGYLVDSGCSNWYASGGVYKAYCAYLFSDGSLGVDWYIAGFGLYNTTWYWVF